MAQIIGLPKLSPTMEEGVLVKWVKGRGDRVEPGDLIAEVETDKANMDFVLEDEGVLLELLASEGDTIKLGAPVAILGEEGEDVSALLDEARAQLGGGAPAAPEPAPAAAPHGQATAGEDKLSAGPRPANEPTATTPPAPSPAPTIAPVPARAPAPAAGAAPEPRAAHAPAAAPEPGAAPRRLLASPLAKTLAIELGIDLRQVSGTGPGGRIVERDVRAAAEGRPAAAEPREEVPARTSPPQVEAPAGQVRPETALAVMPPVPHPAPLPRDNDYVDQPLSNMRKRIAQRLTEAKRDIPHFYLTRTIDAGPMMDFRVRLNRLLGERGKVSVNDLIIKGVALALRRVPACNAAFVGDAIRYYTRVHIGVAVAIEEGLVTPVVRDADLKGIGVIGAEVRDLARRARERRLKMHEIEGSTFTVSNLGMFDVDEFSAIINPPEAGLLAIGGIRQEPVVTDGAIEIGQRMSITMSCDHRVIDGALGAQYLRELVELLERPEALAL